MHISMLVPRAWGLPAHAATILGLSEDGFTAPGTAPFVPPPLLPQHPRVTPFPSHTAGLGLAGLPGLWGDGRPAHARVL